jgi:hypothetical protein
MTARPKKEWILLVHQLPQKPTNIRVRTWRKLQVLGAVTIKNSVYVLPFSEKTNEDFQWLRQEIEAAGGEANLFRAGAIEGATDKEIIEVFRKARDEDYAKLISEFDALAGGVREQMRGNSLSAAKLAQYGSELSKLRHELDRVIQTDFFEASLRKKAAAAFEKCRRELQTNERKSGRMSVRGAGSAHLKIADHQNRRWATRKDPHVDRLASAWLIRRFIDKRPRFHFVSDDERPAGALTFDMADGDFTHVGEDCTFETIIKSFGLGADTALEQIAEIVHDIDLKDNKFNRTEASGVSAVVQGYVKAHSNDGERVKNCMNVFDALYQQFREKA